MLSTCHVNITQHNFDAPYDQCIAYVGEDKQKLWMIGQLTDDTRVSPICLCRDRRRKRLVSNDLYQNLNECVWYAQKLHKQGNLVTAYCLPKLVNEGTIQVY